MGAKPKKFRFFAGFMMATALLRHVGEQHGNGGNVLPIGLSIIAMTSER